MSIFPKKIGTSLPLQGLSIMVFTIEKQNDSDSPNYTGRIIYERILEQTYPWLEHETWRDQDIFAEEARELSERLKRFPLGTEEFIMEQLPLMTANKVSTDQGQTAPIASEQKPIRSLLKQKLETLNSKEPIQEKWLSYPPSLIHALTHGVEGLIRITLAPIQKKLWTINLFVPRIHNLTPNEIAPAMQALHIYLGHYQSLQRQISTKDQQVLQSLQNMMNLLFNTIKARDHETGSHLFRIQLKGKLFLTLLLKNNFARVQAQAQEKWNIDRLGSTRIANLFSLHDIGKIGIPDKILQNENELTESDYHTMKNHVTIGVDIVLEAMRFLNNTNQDMRLMYGTLVDIVWTHHEKFNGYGYPLGLQGHEISLLGRIISLIDAQDAMRHARIYKKASPFAQITETIQQQSGEHFDPDLVAIYLNQLADKFEHIDKKYRD